MHAVCSMLHRNALCFMRYDGLYGSLSHGQGGKLQLDQPLTGI